MFKTKWFWFAAVLFPIVISATSVVIADVTCNKKDLGPIRACDASWPASAYCTHWPYSSCNSQTGAGTGAPPSRVDGCGSVTPNPTKHCTTRTKNCLPKMYCQWAGTKCNPNTPVIQDQKQVWLTSNEGMTASCTPE